MVAAIAGREKRKVITVDIGSAFLRGKFQEDSEPIIMRLDKEMADALCRIDPNAYKAFRRHDGSMYVQLKKPLYGLIEAAKLWFDEISRTLKSLGFGLLPLPPGLLQLPLPGLLLADCCCICLSASSSISARLLKLVMTYC